MQQEITQGTIAYDGTQAQACLDALANLSCDGLLQRDQPACLAALDGKVEIGGNCELSEECKGSAICESSSGTCPGQCSALLQAGQQCSQDSDCDSGLQCSSTTQLCVTFGAVGAACEYGAPPRGPGLMCLGKDDTNQTSGVCYNAITALSAEPGAACDPNAGTLCKSGLACVADSYDATSAKVVWKCVQGGSYAAGQACKPGFPDACASGELLPHGHGRGCTQRHVHDCARRETTLRHRHWGRIIGCRFVAAFVRITRQTAWAAPVMTCVTASTVRPRAAVPRDCLASECLLCRRGTESALSRGSAPQRHPNPPEPSHIAIHWKSRDGGFPRLINHETPPSFVPE